MQQINPIINELVCTSTYYTSTDNIIFEKKAGVMKSKMALPNNKQEIHRFSRNLRFAIFSAFSFSNRH